MDELESQIAKIVLGNTKSSSSYVYAMAEKAPAGKDELYVVAELPLFNPAAEESCERICLAISSTLKRVYKRPGNENTFENAISQINEELGKLASMGQTQWIDKLNCVLAVKSGQSFSIATCGKVSAYLLRNREYTDISCSQTQSHPLKTFENYATGKIRLGDLLLLSTIQLFNYLSMDRLLKIVSGNDFLTATQTVIQLLKETADPQVSFGALLNMQVQPGETMETEVDLENYVVENTGGKKNILSHGLAYIKTAFALDKAASRVPKVALPQVSLGEKFSRLSGGAKNLAAQGRGFWQVIKVWTKNFREKANLQNFKQLAPQKKFFLASLFVLLIAVIFSLGVAVHLRKNKQSTEQITNNLKSAQELLSNSQSAALYKNNRQATEYLEQAKNKIPAESSVDAPNKELYKKVVAQLNQATAQMEKVSSAEVTNLGSLGSGESLIKLPVYLANQSNKAVVSYNKQNGKIEDSSLKLPVAALSTAYKNGSTAAVYDGTNLYIWDFASGALGQGFNISVPQKENFGGMAAYSVNNHIYVADKKAATIVNFSASDSAVSKPVTAVSNPLLSNAVDIAIDSAIYVLTNSGVSKFQSGQLTDFAIAKLPTPLSGGGKIYTQKDFACLYILDAGNNRILIYDKKGNLVMTLKSDKFTKLKDFAVDEKGKLVYVLNDGSLLKVTLP